METKIVRLNDFPKNEKDIKLQARKCIKDKAIVTNPNDNLSRQLFEDAPTIYMNPTEHIKLTDVVVPFEAFLTVLGSGDFAIDAAYHESDEIVTFDINGNQFYPAALKIKGLQSLKYEDFWNFFCENNSKEYLSKRMYEYLKSHSEMDKDIYTFMDEIINQKERDISNQLQTLSKMGLSLEILQGISGMFGMSLQDIDYISLDMILKNMFPFYGGSDVFRTISGIRGTKSKNSYLESKTSYDSTQTSIRRANLSFLKSDLLKLKDTLEATGYTNSSNYNRFASIYLSNVPEFINGELFARAVEEQLMPLLQEDGTITYCCLSTSEKTLKTNKDKLERMKKQENGINANCPNMFATIQKINSIEAVLALKEKYDIYFSEEKTLTNANGLENKDTYVHIRKK